MATREVICADAIKWLQDIPILPGSVVTGLPDYSEIGMEVEEWKKWFQKAVSLILQKLPESECAIFCQTDVKIAQEGNVYKEWVDKGYLCVRASEESDCKLIFHKIITIHTDFDKQYINHSKMANYSHLLCFRKKTCAHTEVIPDIIPKGDKIWMKGLGFNACVASIKYCKSIGAKKIVDPFCGKGSILAVANNLGLSALGVEIRTKLCKQAMNLCVDEANAKFSWREIKGEAKGESVAPTVTE